MGGWPVGYLQGVEELNSGPPKTNPSSGREEDLNPGPPDYKSSALPPVKPFAWSGHVVQNHTCWWASCTVGLPKQYNSYQSTWTCPCFGIPTVQLAHHDFVPRDRNVQKAYRSLYRSLYNNQINARALIGQSAMVYCAGKLMEISLVFWIIIPKQYTTCACGSWFTHSSRVLPTSCVVYQPINKVGKLLIG